MQNANSGLAEDQAKIPTRQTYVEGCPVLEKLRCHEISQGQAARLIFDLRGYNGQKLDLTGVLQNLPEPPPESAAEGRIQLRVREITGLSPSNSTYVIPVSVLDVENGIVISDKLPQEIAGIPGVYSEEWTIFNEAQEMVLSNTCSVFVKKGMYGAISGYEHLPGPPSIEEIRLSLRDSGREENRLLDEVEFDGAEIAQAVIRPIRLWNEIPPPINPIMTTINFPFTEIWTRGIQAYLYDIAVHHYRRNSLPYQITGGTIGDKNKDEQYERTARALMEDFRNLIRTKKIEVNTNLFVAGIGSPYSGLFY